MSWLASVVFVQLQPPPLTWIPQVGQGFATGLLPTTWNLSKGKGLGKVVICQSLILRSSVLPCRQTHGDDAEERHSVMVKGVAGIAQTLLVRFCRTLCPTRE